MCLGTKLSDRSLQRYKAKGKKCGYIRVWKVVEPARKNWMNLFHRWRKFYKKGLQYARQDAWGEQSIIHAFRDKTSAQEYRWGLQTVILAMVHPDWVKAVGRDEATQWDPLLLTLTTKAIIMPAYPNRKVTVREFRAATKGKKVKTYKWEN